VQRPDGGFNIAGRKDNQVVRITSFNGHVSC
jgi:hypothetical protein